MTRKAKKIRLKISQKNTSKSTQKNTRTQQRNKEILKYYKQLIREYKGITIRKALNEYIKPMYGISKTTLHKILRSANIRKNTPQIPPPAKKDLIFCISLYFGIPTKFSITKIDFRMHLSDIVRKRKFIERVVSEKEKPTFEAYIYTLPFISKVEAGKRYLNSGHKGNKLINKYLCLLVEEIKQDFEAGKLQVQTYIKPPKPPTKRDTIRKLNAYYKKHGINKQIPLRKPSKREIYSKMYKDYIQHTKELYKRLEALSNETNNK